MHGGGGSRGGGGFGGGGFGGGGFRGGPRPGPGGPHMHMHFFGPGWGWGRRYYGPGGCISGLITSVVLILVVVVFFFVSLFQSPNIQKSTKERDKLDPSLVVNEYDEWYSDEKDLAITIPVREAEMIKAMKNFYEKTGVQPYLYISDNLDGDYTPMTADYQAFGKKLYDELFGAEDGGHMILICVQSDSNRSYSFTIDANMYVGKDAAKVMDEEALQIFFDYMSHYFDQYYNYEELTYEEDVFVETFNDSADRIMGGKTKFYEDWSVGVWISVVLGVVLVVVILISAFGKSRKQDAKDDSTYTRNNSGSGSSDDFGGYDGNNYSKY